MLYAPTWQGENPSNNYTSLDVLGEAIVAAALAVPDVRLVYKPHPRVALGATPSVAAAHDRVVGLVTERTGASPPRATRWRAATSSPCSPAAT